MNPSSENSMESLLLTAAIQSRNSWQHISTLLVPEDLGVLGNILWEEIGKYYKADPDAKEIQRAVLDHLLVGRLPDPKHVVLAKHLIGDGQKLSEQNIERMLWEIRKQQQGIKLASSLALNDSEQIKHQFEKYRLLLDSSGSLGVVAAESAEIPGISEFLSVPSKEVRKILVAPRSLNEKLGGGALRGNVLLIYGRPEVGKTLFLVNMIGYFLQQNLKTLYLGNEEPLSQILRRVLVNLSKIPDSELESKKDEVQKRALGKGYRNFRAVHIGGMTPSIISEVVAREKPDVIVLDQLRNLKIRAESRVNQLEEAARFMREIASTHNALVVESTQAGDSATQKLVVEMGDVDFSNTGIPGAVDVMIAIGSTSEYEQLGRRMIALPKNKLFGDHSYFPVTVDTVLNKVGSI